MESAALTAAPLPAQTLTPPSAGAPAAEDRNTGANGSQVPPNAAQQAQEQLTIEQHTLRYRVEGKQISVEVLDAEGRVVRSIPAEDLIKLRNRELIRPSLNIRG